MLSHLALLSLLFTTHGYRSQHASLLTPISLCVSLKLLMILFRPHLKRKVLRLTAQWSFWRRHRTAVAAPSTHPLPDDGRLHSTSPE